MIEMEQSDTSMNPSGPTLQPAPAVTLPNGDLGQLLPQLLPLYDLSQLSVTSSPLAAEVIDLASLGSNCTHLDANNVQAAASTSGTPSNKCTHSSMEDADGDNVKEWAYEATDADNRSYKGAPVDEVLQRFGANGKSLEELKQARRTEFNEVLRAGRGLYVAYIYISFFIISLFLFFLTFFFLSFIFFLFFNFHSFNLRLVLLLLCG